MPTPPRRSSASPSPFAGLGPNSAPPPDPSVWSEEQQKQFLSALMGGSPIPPPPSGQPQQFPLPPSNMTADGQSDPLAALMASFGQQAPPPPGAAGKAPSPAAPPTRVQRLMPLIHLLAVWALLAYFVLWKEPKAFSGVVGAAVGVGGGAEGRWARWADLGWRGTGVAASGFTSVGGWAVQFVVRIICFCQATGY